MHVWPIGCVAEALGCAPFAFVIGLDRFASLQNTVVTSEYYDGNGPLTAGPVGQYYKLIHILFSIGFTIIS